ncbi:MAG TPA: purine-nucleoside phosphorylase [Vicinamibacterales bacterium]|nr:purine-nucleoside phosphorylase [Vicinamibacterales bacterium]
MSASSYYDRVHSAAAFVRARSTVQPEVAVVLGSGLGAFASSIAQSTSIPYAEIPHWPASRVIGHDGRLVIGEVSGRPLAALSGRAHYYEGYDLATVTFATRVLGVLGVKVLILTNAAGGVNTKFAAGDLMAIDDHINLLGSNPLIGPNDERFGVRFPDLTNLYSPRLRQTADEAAAALGLKLHHGVYAACHGPSYETPAEVRYLRTIGADAVGMSTVPEAIVARHMGIEVLGLSCITNLAAGVLAEPLIHEDVLETARRVRDKVLSLLNGIIARI